MARKRVIDPDVFFGESFAALSIAERLLYLGLWLNCDDEGRMKASAIEIKRKVFPDDVFTIVEVRAMLTRLHTAKLIFLYSNDGKDLLAVRGMKESQPFRWFTASKLPAPEVITASAPSGVTTNITVSADAVTDVPAQVRTKSDVCDESDESVLRVPVHAAPPADPPPPKPKRQRKPKPVPPQVLADVAAFAPQFDREYLKATGVPYQWGKPFGLRRLMAVGFDAVAAAATVMFERYEAGTLRWSGEPLPPTISTLCLRFNDFAVEAAARAR